MTRDALQGTAALLGLTPALWTYVPSVVFHGWVLFGFSHRDDHSLCYCLYGEFKWDLFRMLQL